MHLSLLCIVIGVIYFRMEEIKTLYKFRPDEIFRRITVTSLATLMIECSKLEYQQEDSARLSRFVIKSGVHVLLVSLFGMPILWSISHFFGIPNIFLVDQISFWYTKIFFGRPKIHRDWPKIPWNWTIFFWSTKKKWEKDRTIGWSRDWPKPHGRD